MTNKPAKPLTYTIECICDNCDFSGPVEIEKGTVAVQGSLICPNCGTRHLKKKPKVKPTKDLNPWVRRGSPWTLECPPIVVTPDPLPPAHPYCPPTYPQVWCQNASKQEVHSGILEQIFEHALSQMMDGPAKRGM